MKNKNTDIPLEILARLDSLKKLFEGDITYTELVSMDIPYLRSLTQARLANLSRSRELLKQGQVDNFSKHDVSNGLLKPGDSQ